ncbi:hypothetical protein NBRC116589_32960 [Ruegeria sp. HU-ET01832]
MIQSPSQKADAQRQWRIYAAQGLIEIRAILFTNPKQSIWWNLSLCNGLKRIKIPNYGIGNQSISHQMICPTVSSDDAFGANQRLIQILRPDLSTADQQNWLVCTHNRYIFS